MSLENKIVTLAETVGADVREIKNGKVDKVTGKGLSDTNFTQVEKTKLTGVATGATKNRADSANADKIHKHVTADVTGLDAALLTKFNKADIEQVTGTATDKVVSQKAVTDALGNKVGTTDTRLADAREWSAGTVTQAEAEAGTASTRRAWTAQRVRQAVVATWNALSSSWGRGFVKSADAAAARTAIGLGSVTDGATVNQSDAYLLARANQTGTQPVSTITGLGNAATHNYGTADNTVAMGNDSRIVNSVQTNGNQTVGGIKSFSSFPVTPSAVPTTDYQVANKKYVDDKASSQASSQPSMTAPASVEFGNNTLTMTNIVPSLGLEVGDVVELDVLMAQPDALDSGKLAWRGLCEHDGDIYAVVYGGTAVTGGIWKQVGGVGAFTQVYSVPANYTSIISLGGHLYFSQYGTIIRRAVNADFSNVVAVTAINRNVSQICTDGTMIYSCVYGSVIYSVNPADGKESAISAGGVYWTGIAYDPVGDVLYASHLNGSIWRQNKAAGTFVALGTAARNYRQLAWLNGMLLAAVSGGLVYYVDVSDSLDFIPVSNLVGGMEGVAVTSTGQVVVSVTDGLIYKQPSTPVKKLMTVEHIYSDNRVVLNYEHSIGRGNGSLALVPQARNLTVTRITKWLNAPIGMGQAWVDVTSRRGFSTTYTNTTGRPIQIFVAGNLDLGTINIGGVSVSFSDFGGGAFLNHTIPAGQTYRVSGTGAGENRAWMELR